MTAWYFDMTYSTEERGWIAHLYDHHRELRYSTQCYATEAEALSAANEVAHNKGHSLIPIALCSITHARQPNRA